MLRAALEALGLFSVPFLLFALSLALREAYPLAMEHWTRGRVSMLALIGLGAALVGIVLIVATSPRGVGVYVPAHVKDGVLVPGKIE